MRVLKIHTLLLCAILALVSCERKALYDYDTYVGSNSLPVPIDIDWATSGIDLQNVTVLFYNSEDGTLKYEHTYEHNSSDVQSYAYLPEGSYTAVIFNELRNQIDYLSCVDYENLSTLKFESNDNEPARSRSTTTRGYVEQPGDLAVAVVENIDVTEDMIEEVSKGINTLSNATRSTRSSLTGVTAVKKTATINLSAHFKNIYYARMPALVDINNLSDGYYVYGDQNSTATSTIQFTMNNRTYDEGSSRDGTISASISTFGTLGDRTSTSYHYESSTPITIDILFQLIDTDATEVNYVEDITDNILFDDTSGSIYLEIDIVFPEELPEVESDGSDSDSGFSSSVEDWEEEQVLL